MQQLDAASAAILVRPTNQDEETRWAPLETWPSSEETKQRFSAQFATISDLAEATTQGEIETFRSVEIIDNVRAGSLEMKSGK